MEWSKIKTVIILFLLAVNVFFLVLLEVQFKNNYLLDNDSVDNMVKVLGSDGIKIDPSIIPDRLYSNGVYEGDHNDKYYTSAFEKMTGLFEYMPITMANGTLRMIDHRDESTYDFNGSFGFTYRAPNYKDYEINIYGFESIELSAARKNQIGSDLEKFLFGSLNSKEAEKFEFVVSGAYYNTEQELYLFKCSQYIEGVFMNGFDIRVISDTDKILVIEGGVLFSVPENSYNSKCYDQLSILMMEKKYIESQRSEGTVVGEVEISTLDHGYTVSWDSMRNSYYLIPSWIIKYDEGTTHIRNAVTGDLYNQ